MRFFVRFLCLAVLACPALPAVFVRAAVPRPNIVHILADDLGYGSVGFNGQTQIATPNLDALAANGMRLNAYYAATVCASSRANLYTGFHQGHANVDGNSELTRGFRADEVMTPAVLAPAGYHSAIFGKWGFGATGVRSLGGSDPQPTLNAPDSLPNHHGFDEFYGYLNHGAAHDYYYDWMWRTDANAPQGVSTVANNGGPGGTPQYTHDLFSARSENYVAARAAEGTPFYMQVAYTIPHYDIDQVATAPGGFGQYAAMPWTNSQKAYAAMITRMDASIGSLIARLDDPNNDGNKADSILNNTLVIFTSDNGASPTEDNAPVAFFSANGPFRGGKFELYEGGIHVPAVAYWPGTIAPGSQSNYRTDLADFMATAADLAGVEAPVGIDGTSIVPTLTGQPRQRQRDYLVFEHQGSNGGDADSRIGRWTVIRQDGMKLIRYDNETSALFNLTTDPDENSPLSLSTPANAQIAAELEAYAIAEMVTRGSVQYRAWSGPSGGALQQRTNWNAPTAPDGYWSAVVRNNSASPAIAHVSADVTTLGVEIAGATARQEVYVHGGRTLTGRNEVRVGSNGRVNLAGGTLASARWVNVRAGGEIAGDGTVAGDVYNEGALTPGNDDDPAWPVVAPPALPPANLNSGVVTAATFNFAGVQDDVPVAETSVLSPYLEVTRGVDFGPGVGPRWGSGGSNAGNELNVIGHTGTTLSQALMNNDYVTFTVDPVAGAGAIPSSVSFNVWRNGGAAARNFAILSSVGGFHTGAVLAQATYTDTGAANQHTLSAAISAVADAITEPIEYRLYAWGATAATGNTHVNAASLSARFVGLPTMEFNFAGVQNNAPLQELKRQDANAALSAGLNFGPGITPSSNNNVGNEFNVAGFSTGTTLQSALDGDDYLSFAVQSVAGMAMFTDSVSFTVWRDGATSGSDYAVFSSVGGFAAGQQLTQATHTTTGSGNQLALTGTFNSPQPTTDAVEFRLYGWNAANSLANTHLVAASMRARFASIAGEEIDPTGSLTVQGDLFHLAGGTIAIDLGGTTAGVDYDTIHVLGKAELEGDLSVAFAAVGNESFVPAHGDEFDILTATQLITGEFNDIDVTQLPWNLDWQIDYAPQAVTLSFMTTGDFNRNGTVDAADYVVWREKGGTQSDYNIWRANFGMAIGGGSHARFDSAARAAVPEPATTALAIIAGTLAVAAARRRGIRRGSRLA